MKKHITLNILFLAFSVSTLFGQDSLAGDWEGHISIMGQRLKIVTHFKKNASGFKGTIDIPQQGAAGIPLQNISVFDKDSVSFAFFAGSGMAGFRGSFRADTLISGEFRQSGQIFPFELNRQNQPIETGHHSANQKPYRQEELIIQNNSISIGGTLTLPGDALNSTLVIMISGSGAQDRDATMRPISDFKPFALLADSLTSNGLATFRYDDRGVGKSTGNFARATLQVLVSDLKAVIDEFTGGEHPFSEIVLLGHSQGGVVAAKAASEHPGVDKLVLMASTALPLKDILRYQAGRQFEKAGIDCALIEKELMARERLMVAIRESNKIAEARDMYRKIFEKIQMEAGIDSTQAAQIATRQSKQLTEAFRMPQLRSLLFYDPAKDLKKLTIPVLALFGEKDTQVPVQKNRRPMENALQQAGVSYRIETFKNANHLFQRAQTGEVNEYGRLDNQFADGFIATITNWIGK